MRFDQWIKLFDNIVTMSNWTDEEIVTMLVTKLTGAANEMLQNILDSVTREYGVIKKVLQDRFHGKENKDYFQSQLEEIKRQPGENIIAYGFRLIFLSMAIRKLLLLYEQRRLLVSRCYDKNF